VHQFTADQQPWIRLLSIRGIEITMYHTGTLVNMEYLMHDRKVAAVHDKKNRNGWRLLNNKNLFYIHKIGNIFIN